MNERLGALSARYWEWQVENDSQASLAAGKPVERLRPVSESEAAADAAFGRSVLGSLADIEVEHLSAEERVTAAMLRHHAQMLVEAEAFFWHEPRLTPYAQPFQWIAPVFTTFAFASAADCERYRGLLDDYRCVIESLAVFADEQQRRGFSMPRPEVAPSAAQLEAYCTPQGRAFLIPAQSRLNALPAGIAQTFRDEAFRAVEERIAPAFAHLRSRLGETYAQTAPEGVGLRQYSGGEAFYAHLIRRNTTLDLASSRIHELGITELERIGERLEEIRGRLGLGGGLAEFYAHLRNEPRFFLANAQEMRDRLDAYAGRAMQRVPEFYGKLPSAPCRVEQLPGERAGAQTFGYYQSPTPDAPFGTYYFNGSHPATTSMLSAGSLMLHELVPGHHLQIALQRENGALPEFRRFSFMSAFCEGYAEYAAELGFEMGMYEDPYDEAGRLMLDAMISTRLVVDTGMNALGWTLDQARRFMASQTLLSDREIASESLRYSCDLPAQALAYKIGQTAILELREEARRRYGRFFDIRAFHDWLLSHGAVTLDALREALVAQ